MIDVQAEGYTFKNKSLEEVMKSSCKLEAKLIGYDETPIVLIPPDATGSEIPNVKEYFGCSFDPKVHSTSQVFNGSLSSKSIRRLCPSTLGSEITSPGESIQNHASDTDSLTSGIIIYILFAEYMYGALNHIFHEKVPGGSRKETATAKSRLYEICTANCWKPPSFECCKEEGPSHLKL